LLKSKGALVARGIFYTAVLATVRDPAIASQKLQTKLDAIPKIVKEVENES
jgi:hypothetical protein